METQRFVRAEMDLMKRFAAFISELLYIKDDLQKRLDLIDDGENRIEKLLDDSAKLVKDLLETAPENQKKQFRNSINDYKIELVPKLTPGSSNVLLTKEQAKALVDLAQERCKSCVDGPDEALKCPVYRILEVTALPDSYESILCPYSLAEWAD